jgi:hypothetical protein
MTKTAAQKAGFVFTKEEQGPGETETVQLALPIPRRTSRWFRHYALDQGLSMAGADPPDPTRFHGRPTE